MAFKLKSGNTTSFKLMGGAEKSPSKAKKLFGEATTPAKDYDVSKGSHNHPHDAPSKMYGKMKSPAKDTNPHTGFNPPHTEKNHGKKQGLKETKKKRTITSDLKTKKEDPEWMKNSPEIQAKKYADERYNAAVNKWVDGGRKGRQPLRSDFKPVW